MKKEQIHVIKVKFFICSNIFFIRFLLTTLLNFLDDRQAIIFFEQSFKVQHELLHKANYYLIRTRKSLTEIYCNLRDWKNAGSTKVSVVLIAIEALAG